MNEERRFFTPADRAGKWLHSALEQCDIAERLAQQSPIDFDQINNTLSDASADLEKARLQDDTATTNYKGQSFNARQVAFRLFVTQGHACTDASANEKMIRKGIEGYKRALDIMPDKDVLHALSQAHLRLDEKDKALEAADRAIRLLPQDVQSRALKNKIEKYQGTASGEIVVLPFNSKGSGTLEAPTAKSDKWDLGPWGWLCFAIAAFFFVLFVLFVLNEINKRASCPGDYYSDNPGREDAYCHR